MTKLALVDHVVSFCNPSRAHPQGVFEWGDEFAWLRLTEQLIVTEIYDNLIPTKRMLERLEADPYFQVENLNNLDAVIPIVFWCLWVRAPSENGTMEVIKGPHYQKSSLKLRDAIESSSSQFFRIDGRIICATFSKDLYFNTESEYEIDCNKGEIYVYPALLDNVGLGL